jgi:outer membrane protein assembly factor BamB
MTPLRRACSTGLACACAALAGCSSGHAPPRSAPNAYALDVTTAGRVRWQVPLAGPSRLSPLAVGAVAVFAQGDVLYGLRLADGRQVWSRDLSQDIAGDENIAGMWRWHSLVTVLTQGAAGGSPLLTGLDASTGQVRWTRHIAGSVDRSYPTADGGLAILRSYDTLEVVDLSSGRVRWRRQAEYPPNSSPGFPQTMAVGGSAVLFAVNGKLTSYDDRTGQIRWADPQMPGLLGPGLGLQAAAGLVYVTAGVLHLAGGHWTPVLLGISAADGHVKWRFAPSPPETLWNYAPGLIYVASSAGRTWQDELDPATGRVRWQVASAYEAIVTPAGIVTGPGPDSTDQISVRDTLTGHTRWIARVAGLTRGWQQQAAALPVFPAGPLLIVPASDRVGPDLLTALRMSDGHRAWQLKIPEPVAAPPSAVPGGILVYSAAPAQYAP